ncbi:MAG TPA: type II CAAX endopeptidase family protein [Candidatus Nanoarchaeia archaeon]|nr:type II CAAX endopeptidase family protein [Candidatus Nanoarchaeia archaeon]
MSDKAPWSIRDCFMLFLIPWVVLPLILGIEISVLGQAIPFLRPISEAFRKDNLAAGFVFSIIQVLAALAMLRYYLRRYRVRWRDLGLKSFNFVKAAAYIGATFIALGFLVAAAFALVKVLLPNFNPNQAQVNEFTTAVTPLARKISFLALVILPPLIEEMVFRGFAFPAFSNRLGVVGGALISSLLFGAAHLIGSGLNGAVYTMILGRLLCLLYRKLGSIWPGIALHMLNNYLAYLVIVGK